MGLCPRCDNTEMAQFEQMQGWLRCKKCMTEIEVEQFCTLLKENVGKPRDTHAKHSPSAKAPSKRVRKLSSSPEGASFTPYQGVSAEAMQLALFTGPCNSCDNHNQTNFTIIRDTKDGAILGRSCDQCGGFMGLDDSMSYLQINQMLTSGRIQVKSCECGNDDPDKMTLEQEGQDLVLLCRDCEAVVYDLGDAECFQGSAFACVDGDSEATRPGRTRRHPDRETPHPEPQTSAGAEAAGSKTAWQRLASMGLSEEKICEYLFKSGCLAWEVWGDHAKHKAGKMSKEKLSESHKSRARSFMGGSACAFGGAIGSGLGALAGNHIVGNLIGKTVGFIVDSYLSK